MNLLVLLLFKISDSKDGS